MLQISELDDDGEMLRGATRVRRELKVCHLEYDCILPLWGVADDFGPYSAMISPWVDGGVLMDYLVRHDRDSPSLQNTSPF
ncbi:hypothetical protein M405DRAFT_828800 [Rhizopogon salebrosus TDB-379]|nr:hypothetical protein M405DRAFT_828800 [Rhizopogon salebrosus TDB-379]